MKNTIKLSDESVLRKWDLSDLDSFLASIRSSDIDKNLRPEFPRTMEQFIIFVNKGESCSEIYDYAIEINGNLAGGISFIEHENCLFELSCLWIAESYRCKGIAKAAIMSLIEYIKQRYQECKIFGQIYAFNSAEICMVQKLGFKKVGTKAVIYGDRYEYLNRYECYN